MSSALIEALTDLAKEKNIDELALLDRLETELARTYKQILGLEWDARVTIDRESGKIYVYEMVGLGEEDPETGEYEDYEPRDVTPENVNRIVAQNAKRVINEIVRDAARANIYREFADRKGELITGTVLQSTPDFTVIKIRDGVEAELPHYDKKRYPNERNEKPDNEYYQHNQRIKALIIDVRDPDLTQQDAMGRTQGSNHAGIIVSRTHPDLIRRLLELEVPEIYDGVVEVKSSAREAGARSKIAVYSREANLDPVGACVGMKGSRIHGIVRELRNENIDVINYTSNISLFIQRALSPAKISSIRVNEEEHKAEVYLRPEEVSLAIGKGGLNIKLACMLTEYAIDVFRDVEGADEEDIYLDEFSDEIDSWVIEALKNIGCYTAKSVLAMNREEIVERADLEEQTVDEVLAILSAEFEEEEGEPQE